MTWIADGKLASSSGCLARITGAKTVVGWGGQGDRVVVDTHLLTATGSVDAFSDGPVVLSRPTGTALLHVTSDGKLLKREIEGTAAAYDISFMPRHEEAVYHPAGRHIVSTGTDEDGNAELLIADNRGRNAQRLLDIEQAERVHNPTFTASGALLYTADHGDHWDLHRLVIGEDTFSTVTTVQAPGIIADVTASPFTGGGVAWTEGRCTSTERPRVRATRDGRFLDLPADVERARPVAWLPDGSLVANDRRGCEPDSPGTLYVVGAEASTKVADNVTSAAVRALLPPPPTPPESVPHQAPA